MKVIDSQGQRITTLDLWRTKFFDGTSKVRHWKKGRSAHSLAEFIISNSNGSNHLRERISTALSQPVALEEAKPEYLARFDSYPGNPTNLDLGITGLVGHTGSSASLFLGVEAKVDESFGKTVSSTYLSALKKRRACTNTNVPERVKNLLSNYFSCDDPPDSSRLSDIRYQLLTGSAGTVATTAEVAVFYILVFKTPAYDERKSLANRLDYERFVEAAGGKPMRSDGDFPGADALTLAGKSLVCIYDQVEA